MSFQPFPFLKKMPAEKFTVLLMHRGGPRQTPPPRKRNGTAGNHILALNRCCENRLSDEMQSSCFYFL